MIPGAGIHDQGDGHTSHIMKMHNLKKKIFFSIPCIDQKNWTCTYVVMMTKEVSIKIVNFMVPGAEFFAPGGLAK